MGSVRRVPLLSFVFQGGSDSLKLCEGCRGSRAIAYISDPAYQNPNPIAALILMSFFCVLTISMRMGPRSVVLT